MPFGPTNAVPCFQRIMTQIIEDNECEGVFGYSDNVTVCGHDKVEHDRNLKKFLKVAKSYNITFNESKSVIAAESLQLLGYEVYKDRVKALMDMSPPKNDKELKRILGLFSTLNGFLGTLKWLSPSSTPPPFLGLLLLKPGLTY